jgi:hypothetical protein
MAFHLASQVFSPTTYKCQSSNLIENGGNIICSETTYEGLQKHDTKI